MKPKHQLNQLPRAPRRRLGKTKKLGEAEIQQAAAELVEEAGLGTLAVRTLAEKLRLTHTTVLHYFGSTLGLLAAVAALGFNKLEDELHEEASSSVMRNALTHARFGLEKPHLFAAMNSAPLWTPLSRRKKGSATSDRGMQKEAKWLEEAMGAKYSVIQVFMEAVEASKTTGAIRPSANTNDVVRAFTALVDGYLVQMRDEAVAHDSSTEQHLETVKRILDLLLGGLSPR